MLFHDDLADFIASQRKNLSKWEIANISEMGVVVDVFGPNYDQDITTNPGRHSVTKKVDQLSIDCRGIAGDRHRGLTRPSTGREAPLYKETSTTTVNQRQLFAVSPCECDLLSQLFQARITPELLGTNVVIARADGADYCISDVPMNTYFAISPSDAKKLPRLPIATLIQYLQQKGCSRTGRAISLNHGNPSLTKQFVAHAKHRRGILCSVEYPVDSPVFIERSQKVFFRFPMSSCY